MTEKFTEEIADGKTALSTHQKRVIEHLKKAKFGEKEEAPKKKKRKGPKGPNPLSCKKSKKVKNAQIAQAEVHTDSGTKKKRKRKKKNSSNAQATELWYYSGILFFDLQIFLIEIFNSELQWYPV